VKKFRILVHFEEAFNLELEAEDSWDAKSKALRIVEDNASVHVKDTQKETTYRRYYTDEATEVFDNT
jgi:hypothetical protein